MVKFFKYLIDKKTVKINVYFKILATFILSFVLGLVLRDTLGGGHSLIVKLINTDVSIKLLIGYLVIKLLLIAYSSQSGVTGGMFIPILTIGAILGSIIAKVCNIEEYRALVIVVSMASFMGATIGCPLSAIVFSLEALAGINNIIPIAMSILISYAVFRLSNSTHVYDIVLERKLKSRYKNKDFLLLEMNVLVKKSSFAVGKATRDLLLPPNMKISFIQRKDKEHFKMDNVGDKIIEESDFIIIHAQTYELDKTRYEIESFFGEQEKFNYHVIQDIKY